MLIGLNLMSKILGVSWWLRGLGIQSCHCCGVDSIPGAGTSSRVGAEKKEKKKKAYFSLFRLVVSKHVYEVVGKAHFQILGSRINSDILGGQAVFIYQCF